VPQHASAKRVPTRTKARKRALDILFEADLREMAVHEVLAAATEQAEPPVRDYTTDLVLGVVEYQPEIDAQIAAHLPSGWTLERMPRVDRNLARLAIFEALHTETDQAVALAECVLLATELSTDDSPALLNGVLAAILRSAKPAV
jgi:N utilization substance protein B